MIENEVLPCQVPSLKRAAMASSLQQYYDDDMETNPMMIQFAYLVATFIKSG